MNSGLLIRGINFSKTKINVNGIQFLYIIIYKKRKVSFTTRYTHYLKRVTNTYIKL